MLCLHRADVKKKTGWSVNTGMSMYRVSQKNVPLSLLFQQCSSCLFRFTWMFLTWGVSNHSAVISWAFTSRICSRLLVAFLCSSYQAFFLCILLAFKWCIHTVVLTQPLLWTHPILFYRIHPTSISKSFDRRISTSLSVDETQLPRYVNLFTNFRGSLLRVEMIPSRLKHMYCFICVPAETNASCCLL